MDQIEAQLIVTSDVHLRAPDDERAELLMDLIKRCSRGRVGTFVLNGDIFDFCFGMSRHFRDKYQNLGDCLGELAKGGTKVYFLEGNHEFAFHSMGWSGVEVIKGFDLPLVMPDGATIRITHGDLIYSDFWYRLLRLVAKFTPSHWICRLVPGAWMDRWALKYATHSRGKDDERQLDHQTVLSKALTWVTQTKADIGIFGHFHEPYEETIQNRRLMSIRSWDEPSALAYSNGQIHRIGYVGKGWRRLDPNPTSHLGRDS